MITQKMREWLQTNYPFKHKKRVVDFIYLQRINKRINRELDLLLWLCINYPNVFLDANYLNDYGHTIKRSKRDKNRMKNLLLCINALMNSSKAKPITELVLEHD